MAQLTYKYRLYPTKEQEKAIICNFGAARFIYNQLLQERTAYFRQTGKWSKMDRVDYSADFAAKVDPAVITWAIRNLDKAFRTFFHIKNTKLDRYRPECIARKKSDPTYKLMDTDLMGYPKLKRKKETRQTYTTHLKDIKVENNRLSLPVIGWVKIRLHRPLPADAKQISTTVLKNPAGKYYVLFCVELPDVEEKKILENGIGVAFAPGQLAVRSDEKDVSYRLQSRALDQRIRRAKKALKRRTPGGRRYEKMRRSLAALYEHRVNQRRDDMHKIACQITNDADAVYLQKPEVTERISQLKRKKDRTRQLDESWFLFSQMIRYKAKMEGIQFWEVYSAYPIYRMCASCGVLKSENQVKGDFCCDSCGKILPANMNGAKNLEALARKFITEHNEDAVK